MLDDVAIVGVGLIGASIGLALKEHRLCRRVIGVGRNEASLDIARSRGAIDVGAITIGNEIASADVVVICTPVDRIADHVKQVRHQVRPTSLITDVGSTKANIVDLVPPERGLAEFIGSHPLAGSHRNGPAAADSNLFTGKVCVVTPAGTSTDEAINGVRAFWQSLGMNVLTMPATTHDEIIARTSHLPHLAAFALALTAFPTDLRLAASGFRDTTRLAASSPELWSPILLGNRSAVLDAINEFQERLGRLRDAIDKNNQTQLERLLSDAKRIRDNLGNQPLDESAGHGSGVASH